MFKKKVSVVILILLGACGPAIPLQKKMDLSPIKEECLIDAIDLQIVTSNKQTKSQKNYPYKSVIFENSIHVLDPLFFFIKQERLLFVFSSKNSDFEITNLQVQWNDLDESYWHAKFDEKKWIVDFSEITKTRILHSSYQYTFILYFFLNQHSEKVTLLFQVQYP